MSNPRKAYKYIEGVPYRNCPCCSEYLQLAEFSNGKRWDGLYLYCKKCAKIKNRYTKLLRSFGISTQEYAHLHAKQGGVCAICNLPETAVNRLGVVMALAVDHCHATNKTRGLLCSNCNNGLGRFKDSPKLLNDAANYLERVGA